MSGITLAAKCAPHSDVLQLIHEAGIGAVELFLSEKILSDIPKVIDICKSYPMRYSVHAPLEAGTTEKLAELAGAIGAEVAVFHNNYFDEEWLTIAKLFEGTPTKACIENISHAFEPIKYMRRYGFGLCLDMEHIQMECSGVFEEGFDYLIRRADHMHMSGYVHGTETWHTHLHRSPEHCTRLLDLIHERGYSGWVVSEARTIYQTAGEFRGLKEFFDRWASGKGGASK